MTDIHHLTRFLSSGTGDSLAGWVRVMVSHEVPVKLEAGAAVISRPSGSKVSFPSSILRLLGGLTPSPHGPPLGCLSVFITWLLASPRAYELRETQQASQGTHKREATMFYKPILEVICHHFCHRLWATENNPGMVWQSGGGNSWGSSRRLPTTRGHFKMNKNPSCITNLNGHLC